MKEKLPWIYDVLLIVVLAAATFLRVSGADWGELQHQHPGYDSDVTVHDFWMYSVPAQ